jgi:hypothetical protein
MDMILKGRKMKPNYNRNPNGIPKLNNCKYCNGDALPYKKPGKSEYYIKCFLGYDEEEDQPTIEYAMGCGSVKQVGSFQ